MTKNKFVRLCLVSSLLAISLSGAALAGEWKESNGNWQYVDTDGSPVQDKWVKSGDRWFYLGGDGNMLKNSLVQEGGELYYVDAEGAMLAEAWKEVQDPDDGEKYWYYFTKTGKAYKNRNDKFSAKEVNGKKYFFDDTGKMVTGCITAEGRKVDADNRAPYIDTTYYFGEDGAMYTDKWYRYEKVADDNLSSKLAGRQYQYFSEMWLYFDANGKKVKAENDTNAKIKEINTKRYAFDENGIMMPQFSVNNSEISIATNSNAKLRYGSEDNDGHLAAEYWVFKVPSVAMSDKDFDEQEFSWFRTKLDGTVYKNRIYGVYGRKYAFDEIGRMQTGFVIMNSDGTFSKQFDVDAFSSGDFKDTEAGIADVLPVIKRGDMYLFSSDELNDGSMITGREASVVLADGVATFGFKQNGIVYGNKNQLQRVKGKYYINGLRLSADPELGYGVIFTKDGDRIVVDKAGSRIRGNRRILKDTEGYWIVIENGKFFARLADADKPRWKDGVLYHYDADRSLKTDAERYSRGPVQDYEKDLNLGGGFLVFEEK